MDVDYLLNNFQTRLHTAHAKQFPLAALRRAAGFAPAEGIWHHNDTLHDVTASHGSDLITEALATLLCSKGSTSDVTEETLLFFKVTTKKFAGCNSQPQS